MLVNLEISRHFFLFHIEVVLRINAPHHDDVAAIFFLDGHADASLVLIRNVELLIKEKLAAVLRSYRKIHTHTTYHNRCVPNLNSKPKVCRATPDTASFAMTA